MSSLLYLCWFGGISHIGMDEHPHNEQGKPNKEEEEGEEEDEDEDYFLERVMETLRRHPELISELIQGKHSSHFIHN